MSDSSKVLSTDSGDLHNLFAESRVLIVDDSRLMRLTLIRALNEFGFKNITEASDGMEALDLVRVQSFEVMMLDLDMPQMNGIEVLERIKKDPAICDLPIIVISASGQMQNAIKCISLGAEDFLPKPFDPILLKARVESAIGKKRLRDMDKFLLQELHQEKELLEREQMKSERLLLNILPLPIAARLRHKDQIIADYHESVTVAFADIVGFTSLARRKNAPEIVALLNRIFSSFDLIIERAGAEKIKTIGDCFMFAAGLPLECSDHAQIVADCCLEMISTLDRLNTVQGTKLQIRIGVNTGDVVAGIIGKRKFAYDLWGDTVNIASRMESTGTPGMVQISDKTREALGANYESESRGFINCKGIGSIEAFFLKGRKSPSKFLS